MLETLDYTIRIGSTPTFFKCLLDVFLKYSLVKGSVLVYFFLQGREELD